MSYARTLPPEYAYAARPYQQYGFGAVRTCAANASYDPESDVCNCNPGFDQPSGADPTVTPCTPVDPRAPCANPTQARSPVNGHCNCPPGTAMTDPTNDNCLPVNLFPGCQDSAGNTVAACILGIPVGSALPSAAVGVALGGLLAWLVFK